MSAHFSITGGKGFFIEFDNGYGISVQFGPGNYCSNYDKRIGDDDVECGRSGSHDAEIAVINPDGGFIRLEGWSDEIKGRVSPDEVARVILEISQYKPTKETP